MKPNYRQCVRRFLKRAGQGAASKAAAGVLNIRQGETSSSNAVSPGLSQHRKRYILIIAVILLLLFLPAAGAAAAEYTCDSVNPAFSLDFPGDWAIITTGMAADDPVLLRYKLDAAALDEYFAANDIWLSAMPPDTAGELTIAVKRDDESEQAFDLNLYSDYELLTELKQRQTQQGPIYSNYGVYQQEQAKFLYALFMQDGKYGLQYSTIINGCSITLTYYNYGDKASLTLITPQLLKIIDSFHAAEILSPPSDGWLSKLWRDIYALLGQGGVIAAAALLFALAVIAALLGLRKRRGKKAK